MSAISNKLAVGVAAACVSLATVAVAQAPSFTGQRERVSTRDIGIDQRLGAQISLDSEFRDELGKDVRLGEFFGDRPVLLALVYHQCPNLCNEVLRGLFTALQALEFTAGEEYELVIVSISPTETPALASSRKRQFSAAYSDGREQPGWHFLTGGEEDIRDLAADVGFRYQFDRHSGQYAHASGIMLLTADGRLSRYFYGVDYPTRDLRFGMMEAADRKIGSPVAQFLLLCFHYDPATGKYSLAVMRLVQIGGVATVIGVCGYVARSLRAERRERLT